MLAPNLALVLGPWAFEKAAESIVMIFPGDPFQKWSFCRCQDRGLGLCRLDMLRKWLVAGAWVVGGTAG